MNYDIEGMTELTASCGCNSIEKCDYHRGYEDGFQDGYASGVVNDTEKRFNKGVMYGVFIMTLASLCILLL